MAAPPLAGYSTSSKYASRLSAEALPASARHAARRRRQRSRNCAASSEVDQSLFCTGVFGCLVEYTRLKPMCSGRRMAQSRIVFVPQRRDRLGVLGTELLA